ncbi:4-hydroxy-tetrahydrodipicolinate reductase [Sphingomicrobium marinum]|uniref:4-hydroxy-tetrahydrodipicolinate reductase n=1 Tax=Sphingomicrobium marinum TaxID=1227950 RepID=UPI00223F8A93|nr:4-hydroxy-tetrahydrodipicolinate reductase [Sphingomicrobium marinum]
MKIALVAPEGRMGRAITAAAAEDNGIAIVEDGAAVLIDFSAPGAVRDSIDRAISGQMALLIGTTGLEDGHHDLLRSAAEEIPVLVAPNTSLGVALLSDLVERAAAVLGRDEWDIEIVEAHHRHKVDAPSGTALHLGLAAERGRNEDAKDEMGRCGSDEKRETGAIGYSAVRGGTVAGDHDVMFLGPDERLILSHRAESRAIFARGALTAARFLSQQSPGYYTMKDVIGEA